MITRVVFSPSVMLPLNANINCKSKGLNVDEIIIKNVNKVCFKQSRTLKDQL
jgi:hypothetical protein